MIISEKKLAKQETIYQLTNVDYKCKYTIQWYGTKYPASIFNLMSACIVFFINLSITY
jgi:hypothetical protein